MRHSTWVVYQGAEEKKSEVPAFRFNLWRDGVVAKLPPPQTAFGLVPRGATGFGRVTNAGLKDLAALKSLHTLDLVVCRGQRGT